MKSILKREDPPGTPAVCVPMHDGEIYHMTGSFNHHHQHAVLQGRGAVRYSSTHRVGLEEGHTYQSIRKRCLAALAHAAPELVDGGGSIEDGAPGLVAAVGAPGVIAAWQEVQLCLSEIEFEWLRQWFLYDFVRAVFSRFLESALAVASSCPQWSFLTDSDRFGSFEEMPFN